MNKWGYEQKYKSIKENLRVTDERIEGLLNKKQRLLLAKSRCAEKIRSFGVSSGRKHKKVKK